MFECNIFRLNGLCLGWCRMILGLSGVGCESQTVQNAVYGELISVKCDCREYILSYLTVIYILIVRSLVTFLCNIFMSCFRLSWWGW